MQQNHFFFYHKRPVSSDPRKETWSVQLPPYHCAMRLVMFYE